MGQAYVGVVGVVHAGAVHACSSRSDDDVVEFYDNGTRLAMLHDAHCASRYALVRPVRHKADLLSRDLNAVQKQIGLKMKAKENADDLLAQKNAMTIERDEATRLTAEKETERDGKLVLIGNYVHESVPVSKDEVAP